MLYQFVSVCVSILLEAKVIHAMIEGVKNCGDIGIEFSRTFLQVLTKVCETCGLFTTLTK